MELCVFVTLYLRHIYTFVPSTMNLSSKNDKLSRLGQDEEDLTAMNQKD